MLKEVYPLRSPDHFPSDYTHPSGLGCRRRGCRQWLKLSTVLRGSKVTDLIILPAHIVCEIRRSEAGPGRWCLFYKYSLSWLFSSESSPASSPGRFSSDQAEHNVPLVHCWRRQSWNSSYSHSKMKIGRTLQGNSKTGVIHRRVF